MQQGLIQAQKDTYNGIEFRSKLESKTAQALDNIGIRYEYEPDGYKLSNGMWYRPDFWLPDAEQFIECKGEMKSTDSAKIVGLVEDVGYPVLVVNYSNAMLVMKRSHGLFDPVVTYNKNIWLCECFECGKYFFASEDSPECSCGAYSDGGFPVLHWEIKSATDLFQFSQQAVADKPLYKEIANSFNN